MHRFEGDPCWFNTVESLHREQLARWLEEHGFRYSWDGDEFTVDDLTWTILQLWVPVPELEYIAE